MPYDTKEEAPVGALGKADKLERFKEWLKLSSEAESAQRIREREDLRFQVDQWTEDAKRERVGRPMLQISLLHQPMQLVQNQASSAKLGVTLTAVNETADDDLADIKQGLYQRIQRDGMADQARLWALDRAKQCGRGWYRINTQWDEESENPSDQEIVYERILYQEMVYPDPASQKPDFSDGRFLFMAAYVPCSEYKRLYPKAERYAREDLAGLSAEAPEWVRASGRQWDPLIAECYYKVCTYETVKLDLQDGTFYERQREIVKVRRAVLSGCEILEDQPWMGRYIPFVPVIGRELQPVDGERRWEGMVRPARDGQRTFNYAISSMVEDIGRTSKVPWIGVEGQFEGWEQDWQDMSRKNMPFLQYRRVTLDGGQPAPPPSPMQIDGTKMGLSVQLAQEAKSLVQVATAVYEPSLGEMQQSGQSGKAIQALQQQADAGTGNYLGNLANISIPYEAKIVLDLMPAIYDRPGRVTQVMGSEDETETVMLNQPFMPNQNTGKPEAIPPPPPAMPGQPPNKLPQGAKIYDLSKGKYAVAVNIGKSFQTRLEQGATEMGQILTGAPELMPVIGDLYFKFRDFPGSKEISERLAEWREKTIPGLGKPKDGTKTPEMLQSENQALQQQVQQMQEQLKQASMALETDQAKQQATLQKAQMDGQSKQGLEALGAQVKQQLAEFEAAHQVAMQNDQQKAEAALEAMRLEFERWKVEFQAAHDVAMAAAGGRTETRTMDRGQSNDREDSQDQSQGFSEEDSREASQEPEPKEPTE